MKSKGFTVFLALFISLSLAACAGSNAENSPTSAPANSAAPEQDGTGQSPETSQEPSRAEKLLADGQNGNGRAYTDLGRMYEQGNGVEQNYEQALEYYRLSAEAENPDFKGMRYAGLMYRDGVGVERDSSEAAACFQVAAESGDVSAAYFLGLLYEEGDGVEQSADEARNWYEKAISTLDDFLANEKNNGPDELKLALCRLAEMALTDGDEETAVQYYQSAADLGWSDAKEKLIELGVAE